MANNVRRLLVLLAMLAALLWSCSREKPVSSAVVPAVATAPVTGVTTWSAECGGNVVSAGSAAVTARGVCWSTHRPPIPFDAKTVDSSGIGSFTSHITGLNPGTEYYIRAYAANDAGVGFGPIDSFTTGPSMALDTFALFVAVGQNGNGSSGSPFNGIQAAVDSASSDPKIERICVAAGIYHESFMVKRGIAIYGGRDPLHNWEQSSTDSTIVMGQSIENHSIAVAIRGIDSLVVLSHLTVVSQDAQDSSGSSYGIYCSDAENVEIEHCVVIAGKGRAGTPGQNGRAGQNGEGGHNGQPGNVPVPGGAGGLGGYCQCPTCAAEGDSGSSGSSYLDSPPGGQGGAGGKYGYFSLGEHGHRGGDGAHGANGAGGSGGIDLKLETGWLVATADSGHSGVAGGYGSGGGGGGGSSTGFESMYLPPQMVCLGGYWGGGGGAGGGSARGGQGASPGGSSIALLSISSQLQLFGCFLSSGKAGSGGRGGVGGAGGKGGAGGRPYSDVTGKSSGGDGGNGGDGGSGGGGAGGSSIALLACQSTVGLRDSVTLQFGNAGGGGVGGGDRGNNGAVGMALARYEVAIRPLSPGRPSSGHN